MCPELFLCKLSSRILFGVCLLAVGFLGLTFLEFGSLVQSLPAAETSPSAGEEVVLFDGHRTDRWEFREGAWSIDQDGALTCHMEQWKQRNGNVRTRGMGYIWTKDDYGDFELKLAYRLSEGANSGVFFRADPADPVQSGFEIQLLDVRGFRPAKGELDGKKRNGALYDAQAPKASPAKPVGQWNELKLTCDGPMIRVEINGKLVNEANIDQWETPGKNPDGTANKFKTALKQLPRRGRIGFQNHGQAVWFKDVVIRRLNEPSPVVQPSRRLSSPR